MVQISLILKSCYGTICVKHTSGLEYKTISYSCVYGTYTVVLL